MDVVKGVVLDICGVDIVEVKVVDAVVVEVAVVNEAPSWQYAEKTWVALFASSVDPGHNLRTAVEMMVANFEELALQKHEYEVKAPPSPQPLSIL